MSQNIDHVVSYQNCSAADHVPLYLDNRTDSNISDDDPSYNRRGDRRASIEKMATLIEYLHRRRRCHPISFTSWSIVFMLLSWVVYKHSQHQTLDGEDSNDDNDYIIDTNSIIPSLIWSDEFNGDSINLTKWTFVNGDGCGFDLCGWGNDELEWYNSSNAKVSNGRLVIEARKEVVTGINNTLSYTSAKIVSRHKADFSTNNLQSNIQH